MPNQYTKAKELGLPKPKLSEDSRKKMSSAATRRNNKWFADPDFRKRHRESMKLAVVKYPESYGVSNRGRTRKIEAHGEAFQGKWELYFYEHCLKTSTQVVRVTKGYPYEWNGNRLYFPDFYLPEYDTFVEVKGYETDRDLAKWKCFPHALKVVRRSQIEKIKRNEFDLTTFISE